MADLAVLRPGEARRDRRRMQPAATPARLRAEQPATPPAGVPESVAGVLRAPGPGSPIAPTLRERFSERTAPGVQRQEEGFLVSQLWGIVRSEAPALEPILRQGLLGWLRERMADALSSLLDSITRPIREAWEFIATLRGHFTALVGWMRVAVQRIAAGDCGAITEAAERIQEVAAGVAAPVVERVKAAAERVRGFFTGVWDRLGVPAWDFLRQVGGAIWDRIQRLGAWLWETSAPVREWASWAWNWFKDRLGIGSGPEGQNGLLQWVQHKAGEAWDWLKERLGPYKRQLMVVGGVLLALTPAGQLLALGAGVYGLIRGVRWLAANLRRRDAVVEQRGFLEGTLIPGIQSAVGAVSAALQRAAAWVSDRLNAVAGGLGRAVGAVGESFLRFAVGIAEWLLARFQALAAWANEQLRALADLVQVGLERLRAWLEPVLAVLRGIGRVLTNVLHVVQLVAQRIWTAIPACIRDPVVRFLTERILAQIPLFAALLRLPDVWPRIRATALGVIARVFRGFDLAGAALLVFQLLLDLLDVPIQLVRSIFAKARSALDLILANPIGFLRNVLAALKDGFDRFLGRFLRHLLDGLVSWLTAQAGEAGLQVPTEWSFGSVFRFVLDVLGITLERVLAILQRKLHLSPAVVNRLRAVARFLEGAWQFVAVLFTEGPAGLWRMLQERASELWNQAVTAISNWMATNLIGRALAKLALMLIPTGVGNIVMGLISLIQAIQSAIEWARQILEIVDRWFDNLIALAQGTVGGVGEAFERLLVRALPVAIGFLANQTGLGRLGRRLREMIERIQERIEGWIERLIDRALAAGRAIIDRLLGRRTQPEAPTGADAGGTTPMDAYPPKVFRLAGHEHRIWAAMSADRPVLMMRSTPLTVNQYLTAFSACVSSAPAGPAKTSLQAGLPQLQADESTLTGQMAAARGLPAPKAETVAAYQRWAARMQNLLDLAVHGAASGTIDDPISITWYKAWAAYQPITLTTIRGRVVTASPGSKRSLEVPEDQMGNADFRNPVVLGVEHRFRPAVGMRVQRLIHGARALGTADRFRKLLRNAFGYLWTNTDPDHVIDLAWGGVDDHPNLWPLDRHHNQVIANQVYQQWVWTLDATGVPAIERVDDLPDKYFIIRRGA